MIDPPIHLLLPAGHGKPGKSPFIRPMAAFLLSTLRPTREAHALSFLQIRAAFIGWFFGFMEPVYRLQTSHLAYMMAISPSGFSRIIINAVRSDRFVRLWHERHPDFSETPPKIKWIGTHRLPFLFNVLVSEAGEPLPGEERIEFEKHYPPFHESPIGLFENQGALPRFKRKHWEISTVTYLTPAEKEALRFQNTVTAPLRKRHLERSKRI